jgi:hypothetical protein
MAQKSLCYLAPADMAKLTRLMVSKIYLVLNGLVCQLMLTPL